MDMKRGLTGTIVGGIVNFGVGYLFFNVILASYYGTQFAASAQRNPRIIWASALASVAYAALITYAMGRRPGSTTTGQGAMVGAVVGFLIWVTADFSYYGAFNISTMTLTFVDPCVELVHGAISGAVIAMVAGKAAA